MVFTIVLIFMIPTLASADCVPSVPIREMEFRHGLVDGFDTEGDLRGLIEMPMFTVSEVRPNRGNDPAALVVSTDTHVLYPVAPETMFDVLKDLASLPAVVPGLEFAVNLCKQEFTRQHQRSEVTVLLFTVGTEYVIDLYTPLEGPNEWGTYWGLSESLDGKMAYQFGSWYFRSVVIDDQEYTYVRHYLNNGFTFRVPGINSLVKRNAKDRVLAVLDSVYREAQLRESTAAVSLR